MQHLAGDFARLAASPVGLRHSFLLIHRSFCRTEDPVGGCKNFHIKSCCHQPKARLVASRFLTIVLGGTAALHVHRVWGAVIFCEPGLPAATAWQAKTCLFLLALAPVLLLLLLLLDYCLSKRKRPTPKVQRSMSKS